MKSTDGQHYIALDHVRALAAFMVFTWHFTHLGYSHQIPLAYTPSVLPFALLDEGHTGVALFMTLSGYLFAKLLDGKTIRYSTFLWNRALRLLPLLAVAMALVGIKRYFDGSMTLAQYAVLLAKGPVLPTLPFGAWSITVEFHYYLLLPVLLWILRRSPWLLLAILLAAILGRAMIHEVYGEVQVAAYWTIVGRIDQFLLGMLFFHTRQMLAGRHLTAAIALAVFGLVYWQFDQAGGFYRMPVYPSPSPLWIVMPTIEGFFYATLIAWYDSSFTPRNSGLSWAVGRIGAYSYSIYLLHLFVVRDAVDFVHRNIMDLSNFYMACLWSLLTFVACTPMAYLSYRFIEVPFLRRRKHYVLTSAAPVGPDADQSRS